MRNPFTYCWERVQKDKKTPNDTEMTVKNSVYESTTAPLININDEHVSDIKEKSRLQKVWDNWGLSTKITVAVTGAVIVGGTIITLGTLCGTGVICGGAAAGVGLIQAQQNGSSTSQPSTNFNQTNNISSFNATGVLTTETPDEQSCNETIHDHYPVSHFVSWKIYNHSWTENHGCPEK